MLALRTIFQSFSCPPPFSTFVSRTIRNGCIALVLAFPLLAHALTVTIPSTDADGNYSITWSGGRTYVVLYEQIGGQWTSISGSNGSALYTFSVVGKLAGTYSYKLSDCLVTGSQYGSSTNCLDTYETVVVSPDQPATSIANKEISTNNYDVYVGDLNGDGKGDYYFNGKQQIILLHGDIVTPIVILPPPSFMIGSSGAGYSATQLFKLTSEQLLAKTSANSLRKGQLNSDYYVWSDGVSGQSKVLLRGSTATDPSLLLLSSATTQTPSIGQTFQPNSNANISNKSLNIAFNDFNSDGRKDLDINGYTYLSNASGSIDSSPVIKTLAPDYVTVGIDFMANTPWVTWPLITDAVNYQVREKLNGTPTGAMTTVTSGSASFVELTQFGLYTYEVRACRVTNNAPNCSSWVSSSSVKSSLNFAPLITSPFVSADGIYSVSWGRVNSATRYELYENNILIQSSSILYTNFLVTNKRTFGFYLYQVRACKDSICGPLSNMSFTVVTAPVANSGSSSSSSSVGSSNSSTPSAGEFDFKTQAPATFTSSLESQTIPDLGVTQSVATTQGNLNVVNGSAQYTVAIDLPPAVRNLKPTLALSYRSGSGNGLMGVGWSLSGLSMISRCRASFATEGAEAQKSNLRYTNGDRLCLDGQKLVLASSTTPNDANYWAYGSEYKTEIDNFSKVKAFGSANGAHAYFKVWTKDGRILTYGGETDINSAHMYRPGYPNGDVSAWALEKVEDAYGNSYTVSYTRDSYRDNFYPKQINFAPEGAVVFSYKNRIGQTPINYDMGKRAIHDKVLEKVTTYINVTYPSSPESGVPVKQYKIAYKVSEGTQRELVDTISECGYNSGSQVCAQPLTFKWQKGEFGFDDLYSGVGPTYTYPVVYCDDKKSVVASQFMDFDGDGYSDAIDKTGISFGTKQGCFEHGEWVVKNYSEYRMFTPIMTTKGYAIVRVSRNPNPVEHNKNTEAVGFITNINRNNKTSLLSWSSEPKSGLPFIGDINGDGLSDFIHCTFPPNIQSYSDNLQYTGGVTSTGCGSYASGSVHNPSLIDLNGDGLLDWVKNDWVKTNFAGGASVDVEGGVGTSSAFKFNIPNTGLSARIMADLNGDGNKDYIYHSENANNSEGYWYFRINTQDGTEGYEIATNILAASSVPDPYTDYALHNHYGFAYDYDKDGLEDLIAIVPSGADKCYLRVLLARNKTIVTLEEAKNSDGSTLIFNRAAGANYCRPDQHKDNIFTVVGDVNNDGIPDAKVGSSYYLGKTEQPDLLAVVTDGFGAATTIEYNTLTDSIYTPDTVQPVFPEIPASRAVQVVKQVSISNGAGGYNSQTFKYAGAKTNIQGRGFLGFASISVTDSVTNVVTTTDYRQDFPFTGKVSRVATQVSDSAGGARISTVSNVYKLHQDNNRFPYLDTIVRSEYQLQSSVLGVSKTKNTYDVCGNITDQVVNVGSGYDGINVSGEISKKHTTIGVNYYGTPNDCSDDFITNNTQILTKIVTGEEQTTSVDFTPNTFKEVETKTVYKGTNLETTTTYTREPNGVVNSVEVSAKDIDGSALPIRKTTYTDFAKGIYPQTIRNLIGSGDHESSFIYDYRFGDANYTKDPNGQATVRRFDSLGRLTESFASDQTHTELISFYCNNAPIVCPSNAVYGVATRVNSVTTQKLAVPLSIIFYDKFQREVRRSQYTLAGAFINVAKQYGDEGRLASVSEPYKTIGSLSSTNANSWTTYKDYDALSIARTIIGPDGGSKVTSFTKEADNLKVTDVITVKNAQGSIKDTQTTTSYLNPLGQIAKVEDALGTPTAYEYDSAGNLSGTIVNNNINTTISLVYDNAGNQTQITDPDAGVINFEYNGYGELRQQIWRKNTLATKSITYNFDQLGRQVLRIDQPVVGNSTAYHWIWDTKQKGKLTSVSGNGQTIEYGYDGYSRLTTLKTSISGLADRTIGTTYDEFSRPKTVTYPNGFRIQRLYNNIGFQMQTQDISDAANPGVLWALGDTLDNRGNLTNQVWGNGVVTQMAFDTNSGRVSGITSGRLSTNNNVVNLFGDVQALTYTSDTLGNLESRASRRTNAAGTALENITESFSYDRLNRLKTSTTSTSDNLFSRVKNYDYDKLGNLTSRTSFSTLGNATGNNEDVGVLNYDRINNAGVHAVTSAGAKNYHYDTYGNMISRGGESIAYDVFNKPTRIAGANGATDIFYGAEHERFKEITSEAITFTMAGGVYEEVVSGSQTIQKSYVDGVIINTKTLSNGTVTNSDVTYLHGDQIGSVESITNKLGAFVTRMSFSDWGSRQSADWKSGAPSNTFPTANGFTGHHEMDQHKLVHMGGRVYDPALGRFLSADLFVTSPYNSQSYNRYSYVKNNPLSRVDPTGYVDEDVDEVIVTGTDKWYRDPALEGSVFYSYQSPVNVPLFVGNQNFSPVLPSADTAEVIEVIGYRNLSSEKNGQGTSLVDQELNRLLAACIKGGTGACSAHNNILAETGRLKGSYLPVVLKDFYEISLSYALGGAGTTWGVAYIASKYKAYIDLINFFKDATLHERVLKQLPSADNHAFPILIDQIAKVAGRVDRALDSRGVYVERLIMEGEKNGVKGVYEYVKNGSNEIFHRLFKPD